MISTRIKELEGLCAERGRAGKPSHFMADYHASALGEYAELPHWEKLARAMAYAISNQDVWAYAGDRIGGRIYYFWEVPIAESCPELDYVSEAAKAFAKECPYVADLERLNLSGTPSLGHITWCFDKLLRMGTVGMIAECERALEGARDERAAELYRGVIIMLEALQTFNDKHIAVYEALGEHELAERMRRVPRYPAQSFEDAVQAFFMQHIVVMRENPFGGNSPGRLDYYLWPYLERDLERGKCTLEDAKEIIDELFLRIDERIHDRDAWGETIVLAGTHPSGASAENPLTHIMVQTMIDLNITHPLTYVRMPEQPSRELTELCAKYLVKGHNRAQILNDKAIINAMTSQGIPYRDAVDYACGGCMEVGAQGMCSDYLFIGWQNIPKLLELMITGGECLVSGARYGWWKWQRGLVGYSDFEDFYADFIAAVREYARLFLRRTDVYSEVAERDRPSYLVSSMLNDCIARGRNMHAGGVRYHDYGVSPVGMPNAADALYAIRVAVFEKGICTAQELVDALRKNFDGYDKLRARLKAIPKYGMDNDEADAMAHRVMSDIADAYLSYKTRWGGRGKPIILTFTYSRLAAPKLGATADGRPAHSNVAHGVTPYSSSMTEGITAAINSCCKMPFEKFPGGASSMWDIDASWVSEELVQSLLLTFLEGGGQIFQGNTTDLSELIAAREHPEDYRHLLVRVGGYSARFVALLPALQEEIINRIRHKA